MKLSKIAVSLAMVGAAQAASAGVITVIVDDFNSGSGGTFVATPAGSVTGTVFSVGAGNNVFTVSANAIVGGGATLSYTPGVTLPANAGVASLSYDMVFSNLGNPNSILNQVTANGTSTNYGYVGGPSGNPTITTAVAYTSGANIVLNFVDNRALSWDLAIDNIKVSFNCNAVADTTYNSISAYVTGSSSLRCVPEPGSMALLGLGGIAAAFAARRRIFK
jgi:hypothetical protein